MSKDQLNVSKNLVVLARRRGRGRKKKGSARSQMLKMIMPMLSHEHGEKLADAIQHNNVSMLRNVWDKIKHDLSEKLAHESTASDETFFEDIQNIFEDMVNQAEEEMLVEAASKNRGRLLTGNSRIPSMTRDLIADGYVEFTDAKGDTYTVSITQLGVKRKGNPQPLIYASASVTSSSGLNEGVSASGIYADVCSEIIISAMSFSEND